MLLFIMFVTGPTKMVVSHSQSSFFSLFDSLKTGESQSRISIVIVATRPFFPSPTQKKKSGLATLNYKNWTELTTLHHTTIYISVLESGVYVMKVYFYCMSTCMPSICRQSFKCSRILFSGLVS